MIYSNERDLLKHFKGDPAPLYFIYGSENHLKQIYLEKLLDFLGVNPEDSFNYQQFAFASIDMDILADACYALPVFAPGKFVVVRDMDVDALPKVELDKLYQLLEEIPGETTLIICQLTLEVDEKRSAKYRKLLNVLDSQGAVFRLSARTARDLVKFSQSYVRQSGMEIGEQAAVLLKDYCLSDMSAMIHELDKITAYKETGEVTADDIELFVPKRVETSVFNLSKFIKKGDYGQAMKIVDDLRYIGEEPVMILGALSSVYVDLFRAKAAIDGGRTQDDMKKDFPYRGREFLVRGAFGDAGQVSWNFIREAVSILQKADMEMKSGAPDSFTVLEKAVTELFVLRAEGR